MKSLSIPGVLVLRLASHELSRLSTFARWILIVVREFKKKKVKRATDRLVNRYGIALRDDHVEWWFAYRKISSGGTE